MAMVRDVFDRLSSFSQFYIMIAVRNGYDNANDIAMYARISPASIDRNRKLVKDLIDMGVVQYSLVKDASGGRKRVVYSLTKKGENFIDKMVGVLVDEI